MLGGTTMGGAFLGSDEVLYSTGSASDTTLLSDSATRLVSLSHAGAETTNTSDSASRKIAQHVSASDTTLTSDTAIQGAGQIRFASDTSNTSDSATRLPGSVSRTAGPETTNLSDAATRPPQHFWRTAADSSLTSDSAVAYREHGPTVVTYVLNNPNMSGLTILVPGSPMVDRPMFDVIAAMAAYQAMGGLPHTLRVCDNALKVALDGCSYVTRTLS